MQGERGGEGEWLSTVNQRGHHYDFEGQLSTRVVFVTVWKDRKDLLPLLFGLDFVSLNRLQKLLECVSPNGFVFCSDGVKCVHSALARRK